MVKRYRGGYLPNRPNTTTGILTPAEKASPVTSLTATATASGGTEETLGPYRVHTFTSSGSLTITNASENGVDLEYLLVAGGGGARSHATAYASGGGGGVSIWHNNRAITDINTGPSFRVFNGDIITVVVGGGGSSSTNQGSQGGNTSITVSGTDRTVITTGGGGGSQDTSTAYGGAGGSGGGNGLASSNALYSLTVSGMSIGWPKQGTNSQYRAGGASWLPCNFQGLGTPTALANTPGFGLRTAFNSTVAEFGVGTKITCPANRGFGGRAQGASGVNSGSSGIAILRYLTNTDVVATGVELLVVAGGAGGSSAGPNAVNQGSGSQNGAGGAGGLVYFGAETPKTPDGPAFTLYKGTYQVVVGAGSAGGGATGAGAATEYLGGNHSSFLHPPGYFATAFKGVGRASNGAPYDNPEVQNEGIGAIPEYYWGSGGGSNWTGSTVPYRSVVYPNQGNRGGYQANAGGGSYSGPGGGGAGAAGGNSTDTGSTTLCVAGAGGAGLQYSISGTATYYAGGGGGFCYRSGFVGAGGAGGGGTGGSGTGGRTSAQYGQANTGGGGASWYPTSTGASQNVPGGSGIVILRYPDSYPVATATSGSPTYTNTGGWHIYKFTASGSITFA